MASGIPTRQRTRRIDENAPPALGPRTRSAASAATSTNPVKPTLSRTSTGTDANAGSAKSSIPVMKRASASTAPSSAAAAAPPSKPGAAAVKSRAALGDMTNAAKKTTALGDKGKEKAVEKKPLASSSTTQAQALAARRARTAAEKAREAEKPAPKRKATTVRPAHLRTRSTTATSTTSTTSSTLLPAAETKPPSGRTLNAKVKENEPARKRRKTSSPPVVNDDDDLADEAHYDADGQEILLSSGGRAIGLRSPKRARAKDDGWEDLDAEDEGDPTMVSEYVVDAFEYMMSLERTTMPNPDYMDDQAELQWKMRTILMDWLIEVHSKFRLLPETLFIAVNLIDRFLSKRVISLVKFQLVGLTALFVAAKYEEVICPSISHFLHMTDGGYGVEEILKAERYMLSTIGFDLSYPNPLHFLRRISKADGYDIQSRTVGKFLVEISAVDNRLIAFPPSQLAAAGMWLARLCLERGSWNANLVHYSTYSVEEIIEPAQIMLDWLLDPELDTTSSFYKKYASKKHMKASVFMHSWATGRWPELSEDEFGTELYIETGLEIPAHRRKGANV